MTRKAVAFGIISSIFLVFALFSGAWAFSPDDALTERSQNAFRMTMRLGEIKNARSIFDHHVIGPLAAVLKKEKTGGVMYALTLAFELNPKALVFAVGTDAGRQFFQMAATMPETALPQLQLIELGIATETELIEFLTGGSQESEKLNPVISEGKNGPYYVIKDAIFLAARENLLLVALSKDDLGASLKALDKTSAKRFV